MEKNQSNGTKQIFSIDSSDDDVDEDEVQFVKQIQPNSIAKRNDHYENNTISLVDQVNHAIPNRIQVNLPSWDDSGNLLRCIPIENECENKIYNLKDDETKEEDVLFVDNSFPADARAITGASSLQSEPTELHCKCGKQCSQKKVYKEGPNQGRSFWTCASRICGFFMWVKANDVVSNEKSRSYEWKRPPRYYQIFASRGVRSDDVMQGQLGDCWFLSVLSILAERPELITRLFITKTHASQFMTRLFLDGKWEIITIDNQFPCCPKNVIDKMSDAKRRKVDSNFLPAFCRSTRKVLWAAILEKAYAKAMGCYRAISGGWIAEAMFDLTGFATETIAIGTMDRDETFSILHSYASLKFPMGASCMNPGKGSGLVGSHAYSILDVIATDLVPDKQLSITSMFKRDAKEQTATKRKRSDGLQLIKLRNPWGKKEWTGKFARKSSEWTPKVRDALGHSDEDNGVFFMEFGDFLAHFSGGSIDICKAPEFGKGWQVVSLRGSFKSGYWTPEAGLRIRTESTTVWAYITACQASSRGCIGGDFNLTDISLLLVKLLHGGDGVDASGCKLIVAGQSKTNHFDVFLQNDSEYVLIPFSVSKHEMDRRLLRKHVPFSIRVVSAKPLQYRLIKISSPSLCVDLLHATLLSLPKKLIKTESQVSIYSFECHGGIIIWAVNHNTDKYASCQIDVEDFHGKTPGIVTDENLKLHRIPPSSCMIIHASSKFSYQDYKEGISTRSYYHTVSQFSLSQPIIMTYMMNPDSCLVETIDTKSLFSSRTYQ